MSSTELEIKNLTHTYLWEEKYLPVLENINMEVEKGEFVCIIGPSGCGKSTLFNILAGLELPDVGEIFLSGKDIRGQRGYIAYMPQRDLLFPWRKLIDNVIIGAEINRDNIEKAREEAYQLLPLFGLEGFANVLPPELSGGMRQRAALLRTVLTHKDVMALDEPFGALDALTRSKMQSWLLKIWTELGKTIIFITHDIEEAVMLADKIYILTQRPGSIREEIKVKLKRPRLELEPGFLKIKSHLVKLLLNE
jgi:ABC-type nitrate/sulfonate/bicarbonate transport system ATPase subunit